MLNPSLIRRLLCLLPILLGTAAAAPRSDVSLRADPAFLSPNGDGIQDQAFFYPVFTGEGSVARWRLDIDHDRKGRVTRLSGAGMPALIMWDLLDRKGGITKDGAYHARFEVWGRSGHLSNEDRFFVDTVPPDVALRVSTGAAAGVVTFDPQISDDAPVDRWQVQVLDETGRTLWISWSTGPVHPVDWDGRDRQSRAPAPSGRYRAALVAWDVAGNGSEPVFTDVAWTIPASFGTAGTPSAARRIAVRETQAGDVVVLPSEGLFGYRRGRIVLLEESEAALAEVVAWVNARPGGAVVLEGYSNAFKNADKDRSLGSRYAWLVYSRLVKDDDVKGSRIRVEGHARDASARYRRARLDPVANGVAVWVIDESSPVE